MRLRHQALEIVDETLARVLGVLVVPADVDRFLRTHFLAVAAENAAEFVDLVDQRIAVALFVFARDIAQEGAIAPIARPLFTEYLLAFELTSILLLVAIVGAVVLGRRKVDVS